MNHLLDFVEDDAGRLLDPKEPHTARDDGQDGQQRPVRAWEVEDIIVLHPLGGVASNFLLRLLLFPTVPRT